MQPMGLNEIREKFLRFFESKEHLRLNSFPLIPQNDKSLLLINSGMAPLKPYFTGQEIPPNKRVTTCQKCIRTGDIENVGKTIRHGTFFEMLGNFSFGDYFKEEIIPWSWEFVTEEMKIPKELLYVSVYLDDDEAYDIWNKKIGLPHERIFRMGKEDNFWEVGLGPCGPCSEIYYDRGEAYGCGEDGCTVGCDCDRYMEFWNLVFTQFNKQEDGSYVPLKNPNIDTGMGLERIALIMQGVESIFDVDTIKAVRELVCNLAKVEYLKDPKVDISVRIVADHIRSVTFMTADGVLPSNEGRGYVLRRLLRRAARHGKLLGIDGVFLTRLCETVISLSKEAYSELKAKQEYIYKILSIEEKRFYETLDKGTEILKQMMDNIKSANQTIMSGEDVFKLYDTYGFPVDLTKEILEENGLELDEKRFAEEMEQQRSRAQAAREESTFMGAEETVYAKLDVNITTEFVGYTHMEVEDAKILAIVVGDKIANEAYDGDVATIFVDKTPFYAESGGQTGDKGTIICEGGRLEVSDCVKVVGGKTAHICKITEGVVKIGDSVKLVVDKERRAATAKSHSATHLLQKALRSVLGNHVEQAGSYVSEGRLRFDFTHFTAMTDEEILKVEQLVQKSIYDGMSVSTEITSKEEAQKKGAMALFGEKYGSDVRVVSIGDYSVELCGGTHVANTMQIIAFNILSENGVAAGVRRIEALTGREALEYFKSREEDLNKICALVKTTPDNLINRLESIIGEAKEMRKEIERYKAKMSDGLIDELYNDRQTVYGLDVIVAGVKGMDMDSLRALGDKLRDRIKTGVITLASEIDGKVNLISMATKDTLSKGIHAGNIIKEAAAMVNGGGGGRPDMAQAGGKNATKIPEALQKAREVLERQLKK